MTDMTPGSAAWLAQVKEAIIDPDMPIVDPHHHLWHQSALQRYLIEDLQLDTGSGHNVVKTVYMECGSNYRPDGPKQLKPVGETEFVVEQARISRQRPGAEIAAIVAFADLRLGEQVSEVLEQHKASGEGLFRGIRHAGARMKNPEHGSKFAGRAPAGLYADPQFRTGMKVLGRRGLTYDTWQYHYQINEFTDLADATPNTQLVLNHFSTPLGVAEFQGKQDEIFPQWQKDMAALANRDNVVLKLGGLAMPDNGFGWNERATPATSDEFVSAQSRYYLHAIECFGPDRCMMESNFPVDRLSLSYHVLYNGLKKIVAEFSASEKHQMFYGTAERIYKL